SSVSAVQPLERLGAPFRRRFGAPRAVTRDSSIGIRHAPRGSRAPGDAGVRVPAPSIARYGIVIQWAPASGAARARAGLVRLGADLKGSRAQQEENRDNEGCPLDLSHGQLPPRKVNVSRIEPGCCPDTTPIRRFTRARTCRAGKTCWGRWRRRGEPT